MKKIFSLFVLLLCTISIIYAQPKTSDRALWKKAKKFAKELTADGWKTNSSKGLEIAVYEHYLALNDEKNVKMAFELGCTIYSGKPIDQDRFEEALKRLDLI